MLYQDDLLSEFVSKRLNKEFHHLSNEKLFSQLSTLHYDEDALSTSIYSSSIPKKEFNKHHKFDLPYTFSSSYSIYNIQKNLKSIHTYKIKKIPLHPLQILSQVLSKNISPDIYIENSAINFIHQDANTKSITATNNHVIAQLQNQIVERTCLVDEDNNVQDDHLLSKYPDVSSIMVKYKNTDTKETFDIKEIANLSYTVSLAKRVYRKTPYLSLRIGDNYVTVNPSYLLCLLNLYLNLAIERVDVLIDSKNKLFPIFLTSGNLFTAIMPLNIPEYSISDYP